MFATYLVSVGYGDNKEKLKNGPQAKKNCFCYPCYCYRSEFIFPTSFVCALLTHEIPKVS